ncbi:EpsG family protein [Bacteroides fragilis]|nr:EpsG family protein [Bacteroides fragilis]
MWFAYYIIGSVLFFSFLFYSVNGWKRSIRDILYLFFTFFPLLLFSSLRYPKYGTDTYVYSDMFGVFAHGNYAFYENPYTYEAGFMLLSKIISLMTSNFQMFLLALNLFYIWSCVCFIRKYSPSVWLSVFLFVGMGFFDQSMNVLRQFFALSIILWAYRYLDRRVIGKFLLLVIFASLFHLSSIIFIVMIWIDRIPLNRKVFLGYLAILLISFAFSGKNTTICFNGIRCVWTVFDEQ